MSLSKNYNWDIFQSLYNFRYTKHGSLKYQTDCAPNNGYYFIPIYDKGEYVLKVSNFIKIHVRRAAGRRYS